MEWKRALVLGGPAFKVEADGKCAVGVPWAKLGDVENPADYDVVIIDAPEGPERAALDWAEYRRRFTSQTAVDIVASGGAIVVIGDPRLTDASPTIWGNLPADLGGWTGMSATWDDLSGTSVVQHPAQADGSPLASYVAHIGSYPYALSAMDDTAVRSGIAAALGNGFRISWNARTFASTRYYRAIAFSLEFEAYGRSGTPIRGGPLAFLPRADVSREEGLDLVLRGLMALSLATTEPEWVGPYRAPGQEAVDAEIEAEQARRREAEERLAQLEAERAEMRERLRLLYEQGPALEQVVWAALRELGATVTEPPAGTDKKNDGTVEVRVGVDSRRGVLEIKGTGGQQHPMKGLRQLLHWKADGVVDEEVEYKGIFVGAHDIGRPAAERGEPFPANWLDAAAKNHVVGISGDALYRAVWAKHLGVFDHDAWWGAVFSTSGKLNDADVAAALAAKGGPHLPTPADG